MTHVIIAVDCGSSLSRAIRLVNSLWAKPELILLTPLVVQVESRNLDYYEKYRVGEIKPEEGAWIKLDRTCFAVGLLAKTKFNNVQFARRLSEIDSIIPQTLALIGSFAQKHKLLTFSLSLGILLPWNEFRDRDKFESQISKALKNFVFRGQSFSIELKSFTTLPEGGGVFAREYVPKLKELKESNIVVIMLGYRNSSLLFIEKGEFTKGITGDYGFVRMIENIQEFTNGQTSDSLVPMICQVRGMLGQQILKTLIKSNQKELQKKELERITQAINNARTEYVTLLRNWLEEYLPSEIDELIISGGTSLYLQRELIELLSAFKINNHINWGENLEYRLVKEFGDLISNYCLESRLTDVYGLFSKLINY